MAPRQQQADAVLLEEAGPGKEPDHLVAVAQQQLGNSLVYVRGGVLLYATVVGNRSGDAIYVPAEREP